MAILILFAFFAGIATILSPCILPILPAILSASTLKGKWRPLGIVVGLVVSFTFFTLSLTAIVHATGLSANVLRYAAIIMIAAFGIIMLFPRLSIWFAQTSAPVAGLGQKLPQTSSGTGFIKGVIFGAALGLVWTPCAGPILAAITTLVATQAVSFYAVIITLAYSIGAAIPMFFIAYGGNKVITASKFLSQHSEGIRQIFGGLMILTAIAIAMHWDMAIQQRLIRFFPQILIEDSPIVKNELDLLYEKNGDSNSEQSAPEITGIVNWINSPPLSLMQLKGKVVLIDFWTYSCINCLRTLPYLEQWYADYKDKGLVIIGVHTPEFEFEKDPKNVAEAAYRLGVIYPIAQDNDYKTWQAYHNHYWPAHYLIDQQGHLVKAHFGEGGYQETENEIRQLLGLSPLKMSEKTTTQLPLSPETYLGTLRGKSYTTEQQISPNQVVTYDYKKALELNQAGLKGAWKVEEERITAAGDDSYLNYDFLAKNVYLVLSGSSKTPLQVFLDGKLVNSINMDGDRKYDIVSTDYGPHQLSIKIPAGVSAYAFTFGAE